MLPPSVGAKCEVTIGYNRGVNRRRNRLGGCRYSCHIRWKNLVETQTRHSITSLDEPTPATAASVRRKCASQREHVDRAQPCVSFGVSQDRSVDGSIPPGKMYFWNQV